MTLKTNIQFLTPCGLCYRVFINSRNEDSPGVLKDGNGFIFEFEIAL